MASCFLATEQRGGSPHGRREQEREMGSHWCTSFLPLQKSSFSMRDVICVIGKKNYTEWKNMQLWLTANFRPKRWGQIFKKLLTATLSKVSKKAESLALNLLQHIRKFKRNPFLVFVVIHLSPKQKMGGPEQVVNLDYLWAAVPLTLRQCIPIAATRCLQLVLSPHS